MANVVGNYPWFATMNVLQKNATWRWLNKPLKLSIKRMRISHPQSLHVSRGFKMDMASFEVFSVPFKSLGAGVNLLGDSW